MQEADVKARIDKIVGLFDIAILHGAHRASRLVSLRKRLIRSRNAVPFAIPKHLLKQCQTVVNGPVYRNVWYLLSDIRISNNVLKAILPGMSVLLSSSLMYERKVGIVQGARIINKGLLVKCTVKAHEKVAVGTSMAALKVSRCCGGKVDPANVDAVLIFDFSRPQWM